MDNQYICLTNFILMKKILTLVGILLSGMLSLPMSAQGGYQVKGVVVDEVGPVIGASVIEKGTSNCEFYNCLYN